MNDNREVTTLEPSVIQDDVFTVTETTEEIIERKSLPLLSVGLSVLLAVATFFSGLHLGGNTNLEANVFSFFDRQAKADDTIDLTEFWRVWNTLDQKFVQSSTTEQIDTRKKLEGAISGLVKSYGDPYTVYMPPSQASMFEEDISGNFSGVGMEVGIRDNLVTVIAPLPESPAENAGLMAGDSILKINDKSAEGMNIDEAVLLIRGERGTEVTFTILRAEEDEFLTISVIRDTITIPTSKTEIKDDVFIISLYSFNAISELEMQNALREFVKSKKKKLIFDLRGNPGGYLQSAVGIASYFLPLGKTVVRESFGDDIKEEVYRSSGKNLGFFTPKKFIVLVDGGSASASEILAGALKEHGVATIIGAQTFGKGSVQELVKLDDGSSLKITIARWLTPNGLSISAGGLTPDIVVERTADDRTANIDPQMDAALEFMKKN
ncbi:MAG: S41 family peptidase [Candidatus Pacebacteria bacterium]|nr:S41 family peptidase [Candidatus Paceibacterota bacterium]MCF7857121.1 S41 family peptidase [Candidatus Paceibacterota bacterium]